MKQTRLIATVAIAGGFWLAGCQQMQETIDKYNPAELNPGIAQLPTPQVEPLPTLTPAKTVKIALRVLGRSQPGDHITLNTQSDGAVYSLRLVVNRDYSYTVPMSQMG